MLSIVAMNSLLLCIVGLGSSSRLHHAMGVQLLGPDSLLSKTLININKVGHELVTDEACESAEHALNVSDNAIIRKWRKLSSYLGHLSNSYRLFNITIVNYGILTMFGYLLVKLTFRYHKLYTRSSILATIATNVVLYGISDTLAQSVTQLLEREQAPGRVGWMIDSNWSGNNDSAVQFTLEGDNADDSTLDFFVDYGDSSDGIGAHAYTIDFESGSNIINSYLDPQEHSGFNFRRFFGFITWGFVMAFVQVAWYMFLNAMFTDMPTIVSVLERDLTDQLLFSPISLASFFAFTTIVIEKGDSEAYKDKMYKLYVTTLAVSFSVWFPVQFINFSVMPKKFQVPFSSSVGVVWNCFLSYRNAAASKQL